MISAFNKLVTYEGSEWEQFLDKMLLIEIFRPVIEYYHESDTVKCVILYIAYAYSIESDMVSTQGDWLSTKKKIFDAVNVRPIKGMEDDLIRLKSPAVLESVKKYLHFQNEKAWTNYCMLKDLQQQMQEAALRDIKKANEEIDYNAKMDCAKYSVDLSMMIKDAESNLIQNIPKLKDAIGEVNKLNKAAKHTMGVESFFQQTQ